MFKGLVTSKFKNIIGMVLLAVFIGLSSISYISYVVVKRFIFRRIHKQEWLVQTDQYKQKLCKKYGGVPVSFSSAGNITLAGLLFVRPQAKRNLLLCHGYSRSKERLYNLIKLFPDDTILIFDYRAHGESQGDYTTIGFYEKDDVCAAYNFLANHEQTKQLPTFGIGVSMGAVSLLGAVVQGAAFKAVILDSAFKQLDEQVAKMFSHKTGLPLFPFMTMSGLIFEYLCGCAMHEVNTLVWARAVTTPIFVIHSNHDTLADVNVAHELYDSVTSHKKLWIVDNAVHARIFKAYPNDYVQNVNSFFDSVVTSL